jgi:hypothetical protein
MRGLRLLDNLLSRDFDKSTFSKEIFFASLRKIRHRIFSVSSVAILLVCSLFCLQFASNAGATTSKTLSQKSISANSQTKTPQNVIFSCVGNAPGVMISYGSDSSNYSAARSPFTAVLPLSSSAQYYDINAQLGGSGSIACVVTVHWNQGGHSHSVKKVGVATGGYNIADPEICSGFTGNWEAC